MFGKKLNLKAAVAVVEMVGPEKAAETAPIALAYMKALGIPVTIANDIKKFFAALKAKKDQIMAALSQARRTIQALEADKAKQMQGVTEKVAAYTAKISADATQEAAAAQDEINAQIANLEAQLAKITALKDAKPEELAAWLAQINAGSQRKTSEMRDAADRKRSKITGSIDPRIKKLLKQIEVLEAQVNQKDPTEGLVLQVAEAYGVKVEA